MVPSRRHPIPARHAAVAAATVVLALGGCDPAPQSATGARPPDSGLPPGQVHLSSPLIERAGIEVRPIRRSNFRTYRDFLGTVQPNANMLAEITPLVRGRTMDVYVDLGEEVKAGTLLSLLYSNELGMAQSAYLRASAMLFVAEQAFQRARLLLKEKVIGRGEYQRRQGAMVSARAEVREARDRLLLLGMSEEKLEALEREEKIHSYVPIFAPFDGRIIARNVTRGEVVNTNKRLFSLADLSTVWVMANIPEKDIQYVQEAVSFNQSVDVSLSSYPQEVFRGTVTYVGDVLDPATRTLRIRVEVPNPDTRLKPEMFATVRVYSRPEDHVLTIPAQAIQRDEGQSVVFVQVNGNRFERRPVTLDSQNGEVIKVLDGLHEGELVVVQEAFVVKTEFAKQQQAGPPG
ncbi:MAG: efflux RND transporter periplasmic adaptor subunit [Nitrospirales bacterium]